ncbi:hypothetical protein [Rhodovulum sp. 12E13]|uniref:hypothetical protein n=1 Tax=Rhodovulum sp. 12E13 TaxID=2203891 RepID=UPI00131440A8|nr:hypothetical protein [Rhodovulum sp. 12E13]
MIHDPAFDAAAARLRALVLAGGLPARVAERAEALLARLEAPVRVALVGPEAAGRGAGLAALAGDETLADLPDLPGRPPLELRFGAEARVVRRLGCGALVEGADIAEAMADPEAALVTVERPLPALRRITLTDLVTEPSADDLLAALAWAARRADVAVWWSHGFGPDERAAWRSAPARLRDHGFLVLDGAGAEARQAAAAARDDFLRVVVPGQGVPAGPQLAAEVQRHVALGRQADADAALLFLQSHGGDTSRAPASSVSPEPAAPEPAAPEPAAPEPAAPEPAAPEPATPGSATPERVVPARAPGAPPVSERPVSVGARLFGRGVAPERPRSAPRAAAPSAPPLSEPLRAFCREGAARIRLRARRLRAGVAGRGAPPVARAGAETVRALAETLDDMAEGGLPAADADAQGELSALLSAAEETLVLLEAEADVAAAHDAVRLLAQLRHALEARAGA